jgi:hypothetical protein
VDGARRRQHLQSESCNEVVVLAVSRTLARAPLRCVDRETDENGKE